MAEGVPDVRNVLPVVVVDVMDVMGVVGVAMVGTGGVEPVSAATPFSQSKTGGQEWTTPGEPNEQPVCRRQFGVESK